MSKRKISRLWIIPVMFAVLTLVYFRYVIFSPADTLVTKHIATDLYGHFAHVHERLRWLAQGFIGVGDYWVPRGGGFPAATNDQLIIPQEFLLMVFYAVTDSLTLSLKIVDFLFYFLSLICSYWYGVTIFKRRDASIVFAVAYSFSMYGTNQLEHLELLGVPFLVMLTLIFLEKTFERENPVHILLTSVFLFLVFLSNQYALVFLLFFIVFRFTFQLITEKSRETRVEVVKYFLLLVAILSLFATPYILPQVGRPMEARYEDRRSDLFKYSQPFYLYFLRDASFTPYIKEIYFIYLGVSVFFLAVLPIIFNYRDSLRKTYIFHLLVALFFFFYSIGQYSPVNIALIIHDYVPLTSFIRVPGRSLLIGYLSFSICAGVGYIVLSDLVSSHIRAKEHESNPRNTIGTLIPRWLRADTTTFRSKKKLVVLLLVVIVIFIDLTANFEPRMMPMVLNDSNAYDFIEQQSDNFRIIEIPSVFDQQAMTYIYTGHDTLNFVPWAFGFFDPLYKFIETYRDYFPLEEVAYPPTFNGLVGYWNLDNASESMMIDQSLYHNDGKVYGVNQVKGLFNSALSFDGVNSFAKIPDSDSLKLNKYGSIEFWIKIPKAEDAAPQGWIIGKGSGWNRPGWAVTTVVKNHIRFQWQSNKDVILDSAMELSYGEWHHVVAVMDGRIMEIFIDGKLDPNILPNNQSAINSFDINMGNVLFDNSIGNDLLPFNGLMDEVRIYDRPLTAEEVKAKYLLGWAHLTAIKSAFYGVKYIVLHADPAFYEKLFIDLQASLRGYTDSYENIQRVKTYFDTLENDYSMVYADQTSYVYENLKYSGTVFSIGSAESESFDPIDLPSANVDAKVSYSWIDSNTVKIYIENQKPVHLVVSQSFSDGWVATIDSELPNGSRVTETQSPSEIAAIQYIPINNTGKHTITLHYWRYESSLLLYPVFYIPLGIITIALSFKQLRPKKKSIQRFILLPLAVYGVALTLFSTIIYPSLFPVVFPIYHTPILWFGISLIILPLLIYLLTLISRRLRPEPRHRPSLLLAYSRLIHFQLSATSSVKASAFSLRVASFHSATLSSRSSRATFFRPSIHTLRSRLHSGSATWYSSKTTSGVSRSSRLQAILPVDVFRSHRDRPDSAARFTVRFEGSKPSIW